jgi:2-polyprenyl-6-methoxyphenol hydroxylase-like FAD-dependent oxidoreductase
MQDSYNLGWKIGLVLSRRLQPSVLETYSLERQHPARDLIEHDRKLAKAYLKKQRVDEGLGDGENLTAEGVLKISKQQVKVWLPPGIQSLAAPSCKVQVANIS